MTKENLRDLFCKQLNSSQHWGDLSIFDEFFESNVVIPRGENRHPDADAIHHLAERPLEVEIKLNEPNSEWAVEQIGECLYRIKPQEPVYEWQWYRFENGLLIHWTNGYENTHYATEDEVCTKTFTRFKETKRKRR